MRKENVWLGERTFAEMSEVTLMSPWWCYLGHPHLTHRGRGAKLEIDSLIVGLNCSSRCRTAPPRQMYRHPSALACTNVLNFLSQQTGGEDVFFALNEKNRNLLLLLHLYWHKEPEQIQFPRYLKASSSFSGWTSEDVLFFKVSHPLLALLTPFFAKG